jgi:hypothetical protein
VSSQVAMLRAQLKLLSVLGFVCASLASLSCSTNSKPATRTVFMGHTIGESSMGWASVENKNIDPLSNCQTILRSPLLDGVQELAQKCQNFVSDGDYLIIVQDAVTHRERAYHFRKWKVDLIVTQLQHEDENDLIIKLNSRFAVVEPGKKWLGSDGASIEIRPNEDFKVFTGKTPKLDGFLVVISSADAQ